MKQAAPILTIDENGTRRWTLNGLFHRTNGPAVETQNGMRFWFLNGEELFWILS